MLKIARLGLIAVICEVSIYTLRIVSGILYPSFWIRKQEIVFFVSVGLVSPNLTLGRVAPENGVVSSISCRGEDFGFFWCDCMFWVFSRDRWR